MRSDFSQLVRQARKGDSEAFAKLYSEIYKDLYYYALCNLNNQDDAADAVSDAVIDAFAGIKNLKDENAFKGWMIRILTAKIKRKQAEYVQVRDNTSSMENDEGEIIDIPVSEGKYMGIEILYRIESLSPNEKMCFSLNVLYGYTSDEISAATGINSATVRTHLARGKQKLKRELSAEFE